MLRLATATAVGCWAGDRLGRRVARLRYRPWAAAVASRRLAAPDPGASCIRSRAGTGRASDRLAAPRIMMMPDAPTARVGGWRRQVGARVVAWAWRQLPSVLHVAVGRTRTDSGRAAVTASTERPNESLQQTEARIVRRRRMAPTLRLRS